MADTEYPGSQHGPEPDGGRPHPSPAAGQSLAEPAGPADDDPPDPVTLSAPSFDAEGRLCWTAPSR